MLTNKCGSGAVWDVLAKKSKGNPVIRNQIVFELGTTSGQADKDEKQSRAKERQMWPKELNSRQEPPVQIL